MTKIKKKLMYYVDNSSNIPVDIRYNTIKSLRNNLTILRHQLWEVDSAIYNIQKEMVIYEGDESVDYDDDDIYPTSCCYCCFK